MILFGEGSVRKAIHEFVLHYHHERNRQGLDNRLIIQQQLVAHSAAAVQRRSRLGEMLNYYDRQASSGGLNEQV
jgi:putative transposase